MNCSGQKWTTTPCCYIFYDIYANHDENATWPEIVNWKNASQKDKTKWDSTMDEKWHRPRLFNGLDGIPSRVMPRQSFSAMKIALKYASMTEKEKNMIPRREW